MDTKKCVAILGSSIVAFCLAEAAYAAQCPAGFPSKPVQMWVGYTPGGLSDQLTRALSTIIKKQQGWTVVVLNKGGAGSGVMFAELARAPADGHTIGVSAGPSAVTSVPITQPNNPYKPEDFTYLGTAQKLDTGFASLSTAPFTNWKEMVAYAKKKGRLTVSTAGADHQFFADQISKAEGINMVIVPATGAADAVMMVLGGHTDMAISGTTHIEYLRSGQMRQIFTLGATRAAFADYAPSTTELGYDIPGADYYVYYAAPAGLSPELTACLSGALDEAVNTEEFAAVAAKFEAKPHNLGPQGLTDFILSDAAKFKKYYSK
ncbi:MULTISPECIES: tripartite tricarboxylate transporter substrate binding protein [unclassified Chelatococcus]|uniref:tripartite tricarboxylate transporter substrate binding protein n=1 Tax=unclassified Chelatococcus TaxID=2638111 RepID=UPI001BD0984F|nr:MULTISPECIES: tripartite tricarboxylate transporter substrate binding protein [unclassified Chelatococcus]MBS7700322.1 tripartite tricarboxylate transporter substrate binding protein [Chelatococcus sp. YT9]MBX3556118.1 tripartite tricarboxylate transporter substrate binding protein [Chelatococcus sp.]